MKQVIDREISYLLAPGTNKSKIQIMDGIDRLTRRNVLTFAVANRFWGKFANPLVSSGADKDVELLNPAIADVQQLASLKLALSYDVDQERRGGDSLSDLDVNLRLTPTTYLSLGLDGGFNPGPWQITQGRTTFAISDPRPMARRVLDPGFNRPNYLRLNHYFLWQ